MAVGISHAPTFTVCSTGCGIGDSGFESMSGGTLLRGVRAGDVAMHERSAQTMLHGAATRLSARIQAGDDLALHVDDLPPPLDSETAVRIVPDRIECRRVERRRVDPVHRRIRSAGEFRIAALVDVR